ncbi:MAG: hypothetical protein IJP29_05825 [Lachnospiraceae bacterium]|nr:hypothetical protein [Lachnospiraceae bacterium]
MRKQFFWMRFKAILKIVIPILVAIAVAPAVMELETAAIIGMCCTMGLLIPIYVISGILTLKNGSIEAREYTQKYPEGMDALEEEFQQAEIYSTARIGRKHLFANASDGFYIIPFEQIDKVFVSHEVFGRPDYYYLHVECGKIGGRDEEIKVYFLSGSNANEAMEVLMKKAGITHGDEK